MAPLISLISSFNMETISYADDTQLVLVLDKNTTLAEENLRQCLTVVFHWLKTNHLRCNSYETEIMPLGKGNNFCPSRWWPADTLPPLNTVTAARNLGVRFDSALSFHQQALSVAGTCFHLIKSLKKFFDLLPITTRQTVATALITSRIDYCINLYAGANKSVLHKLQMVRHAAARLVLKWPRKSSASAALEALHWLPVHKRILFKILIIKSSAIRRLHWLPVARRIEFKALCIAHKILKFFSPYSVRSSPSLYPLAITSLSRTKFGSDPPRDKGPRRRSLFSLQSCHSLEFLAISYSRALRPS